jgi:hypothetical protein
MDTRNSKEEEKNFQRNDLKKIDGENPFFFIYLSSLFAQPMHSPNLYNKKNLCMYSRIIELENQKEKKKKKRKRIFGFLLWFWLW